MRFPWQKEPEPKDEPPNIFEWGDNRKQPQQEGGSHIIIARNTTEIVDPNTIVLRPGEHIDLCWNGTAWVVL